MYKYVCPSCGNEFTTSTQTNGVTCPYCGKQFITAYGTPQQPPQYAYGPAGSTGGNIFDNGPSGKSRGVAGILALFLGAIGVHYFYLGKTTAGLVFLLISLLSCGLLGAIFAIISLIQGIMMLTMTQEEFERKYVNTPSSFPVF
ncbi:MAG: NINE protein [Muribaculaceae bacterium]|nr:NINE protein [Muribaculaceae bacterium]